MTTKTILIGAGVVVVGFILYQRLKPQPAPAPNPLTSVSSGVAQVVDGVRNLFGSSQPGKPAPTTSTTPTKATSIGSLDLARSSYSNRVPSTGFVQTAG